MIKEIKETYKKKNKLKVIYNRFFVIWMIFLIRAISLYKAIITSKLNKIRTVLLNKNINKNNAY